MNNFKISNKTVHTDSRATIEYVHDNKIKAITEHYATRDSKADELKELKEQLSAAVTSEDKIKLTERIQVLEQEISDIDNSHELVDYLYNAREFIMDIDNKHSSTQELPIQDCTEEDSILNFVKIDSKTEKGSRYNDYIDTCFNSKVKSSEVTTGCKLCGSEDKEVDFRESYVICRNCGNCEKYMETVNTNMDWSRSDSVQFIQVFTYKRQNHFKEWLTQLQAKESTVIPENILDAIFLELKKERITDVKYITPTKIRQYLKKLRLNKYYEHIPNIIQTITQQKGLSIDAELENKLISMFDAIQAPFEKHCPPTRKNFLSYSFTLHKFCQLLNRNDLLVYFPLLKSREKLFEQDKIWKNICEELEWKYIPTV